MLSVELLLEAEVPEVAAERGSCVPVPAMEERMLVVRGCQVEDGSERLPAMSFRRGSLPVELDKVRSPLAGSGLVWSSRWVVDYRVMARQQVGREGEEVPETPPFATG
ncbi:hypothetical protein D3C72_2278370 [compost metagenome]